MAHAQAQSPVIVGAELGVNIAQTIVAGMAAAQLELGLAGGEVQFIVYHHDFLGRDFEKTGQRGHGLATHIHERLRLQQPDRLALHRGAGHQAVVTLVRRQRRLEQP